MNPALKSEKAKEEETTLEHQHRLLFSPCKIYTSPSDDSLEQPLPFKIIETITTYGLYPVLGLDK